MTAPARGPKDASVDALPAARDGAIRPDYEPVPMQDAPFVTPPGLDPERSTTVVARSPFADTVLVTFSFKCNLACVFCMVEDVLNVYEGVSLAELEAILTAPDSPDVQGLKRVIFSGGEVTLHPQLPDYARLARRVPTVEHVRIQTNAVRLRRRDYLASLRDAGVDEFFVSLHGATDATVDHITAKPKSFRHIVEGLEAIAESPGARLVTNTAVCSENLGELRAIVDLVAPFEPVGMEFWNLWPRIDKGDQRRLFARVTDVVPRVVEAVDACVARGIPPTIKWLPACLLGEHRRYLDNSQPTTYLDRRFWEDEPAYACLYDAICADAHAPCWGLSEPYVKKFGWEERDLRPRRVEASRGGGGPSSGLIRGGAMPSGLPGDGDLPHDVPARRDDDASSSHVPSEDDLRILGWLEAQGVVEGAAFGEATAIAVRLSDRRVEVALERGDGAALRVWLQPSDPERPAYARAGLVDVVHENVDDAHAGRFHSALDALAGRLVSAEGDPRGPGGG